VDQVQQKPDQNPGQAPPNNHPPRQQRPPQHRPHQQRQKRTQSPQQSPKPDQADQPPQQQPRNKPQPARSGGRFKTYFFSDAHLGLGGKEEDRKKEQRIIEFLDFVKRDAEQLYIVGDLFDYWFEYATVIPKGYYRLFTKLAELRDRGIKIVYVVGNHDFWLKSYFRDEFGMEILTKPSVREIRGHKFFVHHGDGLIKRDRGYRILKRILRARFNVILFSLLHPDISGWIARWSSRTSRKHTGERKYETADMATFASKKIRDESIEYVVMGHSHQPQFRRIGRGTYVNLGDWITNNTYAVFDGRRLELRNWRNR
jgi:UDP-2,3-diacylglucosamine hydrolase